jgi:hypothetical protein
MREPLRSIAARQFGAFSAAQALTCYSAGEIRARIRSGRWLRVIGRTFRLAESEPLARLRVSAAGLAIGRPVPACLHTAAELLGFGVLADPLTHVAVGTDLPCRRRSDLWPHQLALAPCDMTTLRCGTRATHADKAAVDLARTLPRLDVLPVLDAALIAGVCTTESLDRELVRHTGLPGVLQARELIPLASVGPDSPQESRMRMRCHDAGLPRPTLQLPVCDARGRSRRFLDLGWEKAKVGLEYDGEEAHEGERNRRADDRRHNWLQDDEWAMFYATDHDIYISPADLMTQVGRAIERRSRH